MAWFRGQAGRDDEGPAENLAWVLRTFGAHAFDTAHSTAAELRSQTEAWAAHAIHGGAVGDAPNEGPRDWRRLRHFFEARRRAEQSHVKHRERRFREILSTTVRALRDLLSSEHLRGRRVERLLSEVEAAARDGSLETVRALVPRAMIALRAEVSDRRQELQDEMQQLVTRLQATEAVLSETRHAAETDPLTRLLNRRALDEALARAQAHAQPGDALTLVMADLDHFKRVNDAHGHPAGDAVLQAFADCLVRTFPRRTDVVARFGGEEFAALLPGVDTASGARLCERLLRNTRHLAVPVGDLTVQVRCSLGHARLQPGESASAWLARADRALYRAKREGRDRAVSAG